MNRQLPALADQATAPHDILSRFVALFLDSNLSAILIVFSVLIGGAALLVTPREEDPQIVVPLADVYVNFPGHSAAEVEQLVATPLERILYQIDGVEYVYSMSRQNQAIITVRFYVGEDRERSLVKLFKKFDENVDLVPPGVTAWVIKPVEIDDVPVVTLTLTGRDSHYLRRVGEEAIERLAAIPDVSRAYVVGGEPRTVHVRLDSERMRGYQLSPTEVERAVRGANVALPAGEFTSGDVVTTVTAGLGLRNAAELQELVVGVFSDRPVFLKDVATVEDGAAEVTSYVRHGWGPARGFATHAGSPGTEIGDPAGHHTPPLARAEGAPSVAAPKATDEAVPAVTLALSKKQGTNAVAVAQQILHAAEELQRDILPHDVQLVVTRNYGLTANEKVNELIEALGVAILIVIALLTLALGWREAIIVAVAVPVVFGLTLAVNLLFGYSINRVTLFALILALGLLVDDPIVDVENISRHFMQKKKATRAITLAAVAEIRPPLISATLAVIVSFLPLFFITGMMGPYMAPMALNVPVSMLMSMLVAFTITPWLTFHLLKGHFAHEPHEPPMADSSHAELYDPATVHRSPLYRFFRPLMLPILASRMHAAVFLAVIGVLTVAAMGLAAYRLVPLKMLPFDNKNELLLVLDFDEGTTLERTSAAVQEFESLLAGVPEVTDYTSYVGLASPIDFNGLVRHYYLRQGPHYAEVRLNLVGKKNRQQQSHGIALRLRDDLTELAERHGAVLKIVELPPGPPVLASVVAEIYGRPDHGYESLLDAADQVASRLRREAGVADVDTIREAPARKMTFAVDQEKAALAGVTVAELSATLRLALGGSDDQLVRRDGERHPLRVTFRLPRAARSHPDDLSAIHVTGARGDLVPLSELGSWQIGHVDQTIYHKNLQRVAYVFAETVGRPPAECIVDVLADQTTPGATVADPAPEAAARPIAARSYFDNGAGLAWSVPAGIDVRFAGEGEWKITLDVFRDLGLAFGAALLMIYVILVAQTGSFVIPLIVMLAIPLTVLGVMPGFWLLNQITGQTVGAYADPVFFTATAMIGMIALAGIVTRDSIILVDFIQLAVQQGRSLLDAILESRVVRLRPILLTAGAAMLSSVPITLDPIFSGLGWALIFGLLASTVFTLFVIPVSYWLIYAQVRRDAPPS
ncbi:MAG: efflux RND transporter permease subunit [Pirellulaceae bacterium]